MNFGPSEYKCLGKELFDEDLRFMCEKYAALFNYFLTKYTEPNARYFDEYNRVYFKKLNKNEENEARLKFLLERSIVKS